MSDISESGLSLEEATGAVEYEWHAKDESGLHCTYGRPRGVVTPIIHAALGGQNADNVVMDYQFRALLGIRTWCGKPAIPPRGPQGFETVINRFDLGGADGGADERYQDFINEALANLYPQIREAMEAEADLGKA